MYFPEAARPVQNGNKVREWERKRKTVIFKSKGEEGQGPHKPFTRDKENTKSALHACIKIHIHHHHHHHHLILSLSLSLSQFWILHQNPIFNIFSSLLVPRLISHHVLCFPSFLKDLSLLCYYFDSTSKLLQSYYLYSLLTLSCLLVNDFGLVSWWVFKFYLMMCERAFSSSALILCILQIVISLPFSMFILSLWICS